MSRCQKNKLLLSRIALLRFRAWQASMISHLGEVWKALEEGCTIDGGHKDAEFTCQKDIWQNAQEKEETNKGTQQLC